MVELKRNPKTGIVEAWKDGEKIGSVATMGDLTAEEKPEQSEKSPPKP